MMGKINSDMTFMEAFGLRWQIFDFFIRTHLVRQYGLHQWQYNTGQALLQTRL